MKEIFSNKERKVIKIIGRKKMKIDEITRAFYIDESTPFNARIMIGNTVRRIIRKCQHHSLPWSLEKERKDKKLTIKRIKI